MNIVGCFSGLLAQNQPQGNPILQLLPALLIIVFLGYFMLFRPQKRQQETRAEMLTSLKKNDHVVTIGGLHGTVISIKPDLRRVTLRIDETNNTKIEFELSAIDRVITADTPQETTK